MRISRIASVLALLLAGCAPTIQGYTVRAADADESRRVAPLLDPLLMALHLPSLETIAGSKGCKIGFAVVRTKRVNVWSSPATTDPCLYFTLFVTEGALDIPPDQLMATIAHELGHLVLLHTPQADSPAVTVSAQDWQAIQAQELEADRFAIHLLKRTRTLYEVGACEAMAEFLRRSIPDWYGSDISNRMNDALNERVEAADVDCRSIDVTLTPEPIPAIGFP